MSKETLALRALAFRLLQQRVKHADDANRAAIADDFKVKDREVVWLDLDGEPVEVGHVRRDKGTITASVVDMGELIDWCEQNYPSEVEEYQPAPVTRVRPAFLSKLLADAKANGAAITAEGEPIPGVEVAAGEPKTVVVMAKTLEAEAALVEQFRRDPLAMQSLLELPGATDGE